MRVAEFGAFIEILPGVDGLVHISQLSTERVAKVEDVVNVGDELTVMIIDIASDGKIRLSRQALLEGWSAEEAREQDNANRSRSASGSRGGERRGGSGDRRSGSDRDRRSGGDRSRRSRRDD